MVRRLTFGGVSDEMRHRLDHPADGFAWRGRRMEFAVADAIRDCVPPGIVAISSQPAPERIFTGPRGALSSRAHFARRVEAR
jgi:hypothetical protein